MSVTLLFSEKSTSPCPTKCFSCWSFPFIFIIITLMIYLFIWKSFSKKGAEKGGMAAMTKAGPNWSQEVGSLFWVSHLGGRVPSTWTIFCCFSQTTCRELDWKGSHSDMNYTHLGCQHHRRWFYLLSTIPTLLLVLGGGGCLLLAHPMMEQCPLLLQPLLSMKLVWNVALMPECFHHIPAKPFGLMGLFSCRCPENALFKVTC